MSVYRELLVVMALPQESAGVLEAAGVRVTYCGIGKVNATITLMDALGRCRSDGYPLPAVVNFGSAGSHRLNTGALVGCTRFVQRDMDVSALGYAVGETPYEDGPATLAVAQSFAGLPDAVCGSGDSFATAGASVQCDVLDMEAYALAKVCRHFGVEFWCAKYVTDGADHGAARDWQSNVHRAAHDFLELYRGIA